MRILLALLLAAGLSACDNAAGPGGAATVRYAVSAPAAITYTDASGATQSATASAAWDTEVAVASGTPVVLTALSSNGQPLEARIYVNGQLAKSSHGTHVRLSTASSPSSSGEIEVEGPIDQISSSEITVLGLSFQIDAQTRFEDDDDRPLTLADFAVGMRVEVEGRPLGGGGFRATKVEIDDDGYDDDEVEVEGRISAIDADAFTIAGRLVRTNDQTRYYGDDEQPVERSYFRVGDEVEAEGYLDDEGVFVATEIEAEDD